MGAYHALWDLAYYRLVEVGIGVDPVWVSIQRGIVTAFLLLVGAGLWLAHRDGIDWRRFWKREALLIAAAAGVSIVTWFQFGAYFSFFGVLHAIALCSLLALPLVRAPIWVSGAIAAVVLVLPIASFDAFNTRWLAWIGFFSVTPETADLVPVFPWFGVVLMGMIGMRLLAGTPMFSWSSEAWPVKGLALLGRWSLVIYLLHQPLLFGIISTLAGFLGR